MFANFLSQVLKLTDTFNEVIILCLRNYAPVGEKAKIILGNFKFESLMKGKISVTDLDRKKGTWLSDVGHVLHVSLDGPCTREIYYLKSVRLQCPEDLLAGKFDSVKDME